MSLVVGSDIPDLRPSDIRAAVDALSEAYFMKTAAVSGRGDKPPDCVLGPAADGGFWVVGVRRRRRNWSGEGEGSGGNASPSSLLLPDTLFEVCAFLSFFLSISSFTTVDCFGEGTRIPSLSLSLSLTHE